MAAGRSDVLARGSLGRCSRPFEITQRPSAPHQQATDCVTWRRISAGAFPMLDPNKTVNRGTLSSCPFSPVKSSTFRRLTHIYCDPGPATTPNGLHIPRQWPTKWRHSLPALPALIWYCTQRNEEHRAQRPLSPLVGLTAGHHPLRYIALTIYIICPSEN